MGSIKEKVSEIVREKQKDKDFKDTSVVEYTRKFQAQYDIITLKDLSDIEKDPITAYKVIDKAKIWPAYNIQELKASGVKSGNSYLMVKTRESLTVKPEDSTIAREMYVESVTELRPLLESEISIVELKNQLYAFYKKWGKIITDALMDKSRYKYLSSYYIDVKSVEKVWSKRFINQIQFKSDSSQKIFLEANMHNALSQAESDSIKKAKEDKIAQNIISTAKEITDAQDATNKEELSVVLYKRYEFYNDNKTLQENKDVVIGKLQKYLDHYTLNQSVTLRNSELPREENWDWAGIKKIKSEKAEKDEWGGGDIYSMYGISRSIKRSPLEYIKRTDGLAIPEITVSSIQEHFGYKDVVFGNYVKNEESKEHVRHFLGAMVDLAELLNIDIKAINKFGELSIFFGALGCGHFSGAMACYYSDRKAINLTKKTGDGSLAHEWFHYLDNISGEGNEKRNDSRYASQGVSLNDNVKIKKAFSDIMYEIKQGDGFDGNFKFEKFRMDKYPIFRLYGVTVEECIKEVQRKFKNYNDYYYIKKEKKAQQYYRYIATKFGLNEITVPLKVQGSRYYYVSKLYEAGKDYYTLPFELFARAFESYIEFKLSNQDRSSNYLVNIQSGMGLAGLLIPRTEWPYPHGVELARLVVLFDSLIHTIKQEFNIGSFEWFSDVRQDEYIDLKKTENEKVESGVIVTEEEKVEVIDDKGIHIAHNDSATDIKEGVIIPSAKKNIEALTNPETGLGARLLASLPDRIENTSNFLKTKGLTLEGYKLLGIEEKDRLQKIYEKSEFHPSYKSQPVNDDKEYFTDKLKSIKIAQKFGSEEEKVYFSEMSKAIKIALKYL